MAKIADNIVQGTYRPIAHHYSVRLAFLGPMAAAQACLGLSDVACALFSLCCSVGLVVLACVGGTQLAGAGAGFVSGLTVALLPLDVILATQPFPDGSAAFFSGVAGLLVLLTSTRRLLIVAGVFAGIGYLMKETGAFVLLLPFSLGLLRRSLAVTLLPCVGFVLVVLAEFATWGIWVGDPFLRWRASTSMLSFWNFYYPDARSIIYRLTVEFPLLMFTPTSAQFGHLGLFFWLALAGLWSVRSNGFGRSLVLWVVTSMGAILFFPLCLNPYRPALIAYARHLYPLVVPVCIAIGLAFSLVRRRWLSILALVTYAASSIMLTLWNYRYQSDWTRGAREAFEFTRSLNPRVVYTEKVGVEILHYWLGFPLHPRMMRHEEIDPDQFEPGILVENGAWIDAGEIVPHWRGREPKGWILLWERPYPNRPSLRQLATFQDPGWYRIRIWQVGPSP